MTETVSRGFNKTENDISKEKAMTALSEFLRPEFLGRVDEVIVFNKLGFDELKQIAGLLLKELAEALKEKDIKLSYDEKAKEKIAVLSDGGKYNARDIRKVIRKEVEDRIAQTLLDNFERKIEAIHVSADDNSIVIATM